MSESRRGNVSLWACVLYSCTEFLTFPWLGFEGFFYSTVIGLLVIFALRWRAAKAWRILLVSLLGVAFCVYPSIFELVLWHWRQRLADSDASHSIFAFLGDFQPYSGSAFFRAIVFSVVTALITLVPAMRDVAKEN